MGIARGTLVVYPGSVGEPLVGVVTAQSPGGNPVVSSPKHTAGVVRKKEEVEPYWLQAGDTLWSYARDANGRQASVLVVGTHWKKAHKRLVVVIQEGRTHVNMSLEDVIEKYSPDTLGNTYYGTVPEIHKIRLRWEK